MKKNILKICISCLIIVLTFSCTSLQQDVMISSVDSEKNEVFEEIESAVATLDASFCLGEKITYQIKFLETSKHLFASTFFPSINLRIPFNAQSRD